jgi:hypothetical protein
LVLAVSDASTDHAAAAMTKLLVGVALLITFLLGLVMMASVVIIGGQCRQPDRPARDPPELSGPLSIRG